MFSQLYWLRLFFSALQSITNFLKANDGDDILREYARLETLKSKTETLLVHKLVAFIFEQYSMYPAEDDVVSVCNAALKMFGNVKGGIVSKAENKFSRNFVDDSIWFCGNSLISIANFISFFLVGPVWCKTKERCCVQSHYEPTQSTPEKHSPHENSWNKHMWKFTSWNEWTGERECEELFADLPLT